MSKRIEIEALLAIDGGLDYFIHRYPAAEPARHKKNHKFKLREEKTESASLKQMKDGVWVLADFGDDSKPRNAVLHTQYVDGIDFIDALKKVAAFYNYDGVDEYSQKPDYKEWPALPDEAEGSMSFAYKEFTRAELRTIYSEGAWLALGKDDETRESEGIKIFTYYHLKSLASYTHTSGGKTRQFISNELFPIFLFDEGDFKKLYKPRDKKKYRFMSYGPKPVDFIHGLEQAKKKVARMQADDIAEEKSDDEQDRKKDKKLDELLRCSGGSDALNAAALGYNVVWPNAETAAFTPKQYADFCKLAYQVINVPDIDATGLKVAHRDAMQYLDLRTVYLPTSLRDNPDSRGNAKKDVKDYLASGYRKHDFKELVKTALPYRFWDEEVMKDKEGKTKFRFGRVQYSYQFNNVFGYNFLYRNGFARFPSAKEKEGFIYVHVQDNIVKPVMAHEVKGFIHSFLESRRMETDLRNTIYRSPQLSESSLSNLPMFEGNFTTHGPDYQYIFFQSAAWKVTAAGIAEEKLGTIDRNVWEQKVIKHKPTICPPMFTTSKSTGSWDIQVTDPKSMFFKFLIQTCRVHWRAELEDRLNFWQLTPAAQKEYAETHGLTKEDVDNLLLYQYADAQKDYLEKNKFAIDGILLTEEEATQQKQHLLNRIFAIGYMLHRYKNPAKPWAVFAMDGKISGEGESHGGSGKGLVAKALYKFLAKVQLDGRNPKLTENPHIFENIGPEIDMIHIEDTWEHLNFRFFYAPLTSAMTVNPKQKQSIEISYEESPKFWFDSNYGDKMTDSSSVRRKLYTEFSDYYHENSDASDYLQTRTPADDFDGQNLFTDWDENEWNLFYNFMAQCLSFYLSCEDKITPPMGNLSKRNLMSEMGENFQSWADAFFDPSTGRLNTLLDKKATLEDFISTSKLKIYTPQKFTKSIKAWCKFNYYEFNPADLLNTQGRIMRKINGQSVEHIYIQTAGHTIKEADIETF